MNGNGIRDTARVLKISPTTVIEALKKSASSDAAGQPTATSADTVIAHLGNRRSHRSRDGRDVELRSIEAAATLAVARDRP